MGLSRMFLRSSRPGRNAPLPDHRYAYAADQGGAAALEFTLVLPFLLLLLFAIIQVGVVFNHYIQLANGVSAAARSLAISRGSTTPYTNALSALNAAAPNLNSFSSPLSGQALTVSVAGTACTSSNQAAACANAFTQGATASVTASYPCNLTVLWVNVSSCAISSSASEYIQ